MGEGKGAWAKGASIKELKVKVWPRTDHGGNTYPHLQVGY